jgi:hypothetical protein
MDKESSDVARPYELASELESGVAYWIKNETNAAITFKISRPEGESSSSEVLLKPDGDLPPEAPVTYQKAASVSGGGSSAGGGGGCLLR